MPPSISFHASAPGRGPVSALPHCQPAIRDHMRRIMPIFPICPVSAGRSDALGWTKGDIRHACSVQVLRTNGVVFHHAERTVDTRSHQSSVVARHRHRDEAHHDGARLRCERTQSAKLLGAVRVGIAASVQRRRSLKVLEASVSRGVKRETYLSSPLWSAVGLYWRLEEHR
jgi:hypothetical protein